MRRSLQLILVVLLFFVIVKPGYACLPVLGASSHILVLCQNNNCSQGFAINHGICGSTSISVSELTDIEIQSELSPWATTSLNGIYELRNGNLTMVLDSTTPSELDKIKNEWQEASVRQEQYALAAQLIWIAILILITLLVVGIPYYLVLVKKDKYIREIFILALLFQIIGFFGVNILLGIVAIGDATNTLSSLPPWAVATLAITGTGILVIFLLAVLIEVLYLLIDGVIFLIRKFRK